MDVIITSDLSWNEHINETVKKASKRLYFLVQLKRAKLPCRDLVLFYATCIRSILFMQRQFSFMLCPSIYVNTQFSLWLPMYLFLINYRSIYLSNCYYVFCTYLITFLNHCVSLVCGFK